MSASAANQSARTDICGNQVCRYCVNSVTNTTFVIIPVAQDHQAACTPQKSPNAMRDQR